MNFYLILNHDLEEIGMVSVTPGDQQVEGVLNQVQDSIQVVHYQFDDFGLHIGVQK